MKFLLFLSETIIPILIFWIVVYGIVNHRPVYEDFVSGAKEGFQTVLGILPTLIGLMVAVGVLRASGFLELLSSVFAAVIPKWIYPTELIPLSLVKMFSSSASTGLLLDIFKEHGPNSLLGRTAAIMMSSTETIFYTLSVYFMSVNIKKSRYTVTGALICTIAGLLASIYFARFV